jgi:O-acetylserine/cysteine efflux transporter
MKPAHVALAIAISLIWGINFVAAKAAVGYFPAFLFLAIRLTIVILILLPFIKRPVMPMLQLFKISIVMVTFHFGFMFAALEHGLDSSVAVVIDQLRVPIAVTLGYFLFGEVLNKSGIFGIVVALLGTFVIVGTPNITENYPAFWMLVFSSTAWAFYNIQVKNLGEVDALSFIGWMSILGAPQLYIISFFIEHNQIALILDAPKMAIVSLLYVSIAATIIAHSCWYYLLKIYPVNLVVPYSLLVPVFGMLAGVAMLDEQMTWQIIVGGALTVIGVAIVVIKKPRVAKVGDET